MNIVIPMAGAGSRFRQAGYSLPKPLIPVAGEPMYAWAVKSLPIDRAHRLIFICLQDHLDRFPLEKDIRQRYPQLEVEVVGLKNLTGGQAETVLAAQSWIDNQEPLLIFNADTYVPEAFLAPWDPQGVALDGIIQTFHASDPRYSFVKIGPDGFIDEVAEKVVISEHATTGLYYFSRGSDFVFFTERFLTLGRRVNGESYVMLTYAEMLQAGKKIARVGVASQWVLGTPEELERFLAHFV